MSLSPQNNILNLYMPAGQEAEHCFAMGELPDEVLETASGWQNSPRCCVAWRSYFLTIYEKTGSHDIVRLHRLILQMNRALGMFEAQSKLWRLASLAQSSGTGDQMGDAGRARRAATPLVSLRGNTCQRSAGKLPWRSIPHIIVTSATCVR